MFSLLRVCGCMCGDVCGGVGGWGGIEEGSKKGTRVFRFIQFVTMLTMLG